MLPKIVGKNISVTSVGSIAILLPIGEHGTNVYH